MDYQRSKYYGQARKRVQEKKKFYRSLATYLVFSVFFFVLNMITSPGGWWWYWPVLGWGIGIAAHYVKVFGLPGFDFNSPAWEEQQVEEEVERMEAMEEYHKWLKSKEEEQAIDLKPLSEIELEEKLPREDEEDFV